MLSNVVDIAVHIVGIIPDQAEKVHAEPSLPFCSALAALPDRLQQSYQTVQLISNANMLAGGEMRNASQRFRSKSGFRAQASDALVFTHDFARAAIVAG